jgi:SAM-dependent methyltransferase
MTEKGPRRPHAAPDGQGRRHKARKIRDLLALTPAQSIRMLEIGCGSGAIAHYFATCAELDCAVDAVDVIDQRQAREGYSFQVVDGVRLPFGEDRFDVVISNHVIEHVGDGAEQLTHLREIARVLVPGGVAYLATPNRWQMVEPHYRLAFLSWLPRRWRSSYLRISGKGGYYDCEPLRMGELESMIDVAGLQYRNLCVPALRHVLAVEQNGSRIARALLLVPDWTLQGLRRLSPTHVYLLRRALRTGA